MANQADYPAVLFFCQATELEAKEFFNSFWPEARVVSDKEHFFYQAFGLKQASLNQMIKPAVWLRNIQTTLKGNFVGKFVGDVWMMPGIFLVKNKNVIWQHDFQHVGDHPDFALIPQQVKKSK